MLLLDSVTAKLTSSFEQIYETEYLFSALVVAWKRYDALEIVRVITSFSYFWYDSQERERADILDQYRALSHEAERYETQTHHLESEGSNLKLELLSKDSEVRRNRDKLDQAEREIQEVRILSCLKVLLCWPIFLGQATLQSVNC